MTVWAFLSQVVGMELSSIWTTWNTPASLACAAVVEFRRVTRSVLLVSTPPWKKTVPLPTTWRWRLLHNGHGPSLPAN